MSTTKETPSPFHISLVNNHISTPHSASRKKFQSIESIFSTQTPNSIQSIERNLPLPLPLPLAPFYLNMPEKPPLHAKILIKVRRPEWKSKRPTGGKPFPRNLPKQIPNIYNETANLPIRRLLSDPYAIIDTAKTTRLVPIKYKECRSTRINKHPPQPLAQRFTAPMLLFFSPK